MKTIGLIGGMSWESSIEYYRIINQLVAQKLGGSHSAKCVMYSLDFFEIEALQDTGRWDEAADMLVDAARRIEMGGADFFLICTNTMHLMADEVQENVSIPLIHIADATADDVKRQGLKSVGLLGTRFTMEKDFYKGRLENKHGIQVIIPQEGEREIVHRVIYDELILGDIRPASKEQYIVVMENLINQGAQGIILGCTEIPLLVGEGDVSVPVFDTMRIHAEAAVAYALEGVLQP